LYHACTGPWAFVDPLAPKRPPAHPLVNGETAQILDEAVVRLITLRHIEWGDCLAELDALTSLALQLQLRLPDAVADAIDQGYSWLEVAEQLDVHTGHRPPTSRPHPEGALGRLTRSTPSTN
jgi:hypothetical protein